MASGVRIKYVSNRSFARQVLNSDAAVSIVAGKGEEVKARADSMGRATYATDAMPGRNRAHAIVYTPDDHAVHSNAKHNSLLRALG